jgi:hypothetical protein
MKEENYISELDTQRFGFKIAKVNNFGEKPEKILNFLKQSGVQLVISKINSSEINLINRIESLGFKIKDSQVRYSYLLKNINESLFPANNSKVTIRKFQKKDWPDIKMILKESFNNYGHYFADENLDKKKCMDVYIDWGKRSCEDKNVADKVFVALYDKEIAGILTFKKNFQGQTKYAGGGLGAINSKFRGKEIFKMLAVKGLLWGMEEKLDWVEHNVLTTNYSVNVVFSSLGFKINNSFMTMHCWL